MVRQFQEAALLIASGNKGKVLEIRELLDGLPVAVESLDGRFIEEPEENGDSFIDNAVIKARYYSKATGLPALADDSGLVVNALNGAPGIYSARWGGEARDFTIAMQRVERELSQLQTTDFSAAFVCALALYWPDGHVETVEGTVKGQLTFPSRGDKGFGYDPIFIPDGYDVTFAEMEPQAKNVISHRMDAFKKLVTACFAFKDVSVRL